MACAQQLPRKAPDFAIQTAPDKYIWLNEYAGKTVIVAFILTYCAHCQNTTGILNRIQTDYAARGVQIIESAIEDMSSLHIPEFEKKFSPAYPVGYNDRGYVVKFLQRSENDPLMMPQLVFIDRTGMIRAEYAGDDPIFAKDQEKNLREILERTIKEGQPATRTAAPGSQKSSSAKMR
jgi:hypothetical protein